MFLRSARGDTVGDLVLDVFLSFLLAAILYEELLNFPQVKQKRIVFAANNSPCCECHSDVYTARTSQQQCTHQREKITIQRLYCSVCPFGILLCILCDTHGPDMLMRLAYPAERFL